MHSSLRVWRPHDFRDVRKWRGRHGRISVFAVLALVLSPDISAADQGDIVQAATAADSVLDVNRDTIHLPVYNVKADRIEDFGFRVDRSTYRESARPNALTIWFTKFAPLITEVLPNTAAAKAGLKPGERILKSDGRPTVGGPFSTGKFGQWGKTEKKKWNEVAAGRTNVTWTLEVETPATKTVRTVTMVVPTPAPRWGAAVWRKPQDRNTSSVAEPGPLAERSRTVLDHGIWTLLDRFIWQGLGQDASFKFAPTGYRWQVGDEREGWHRIFVTQFRGRTDIIFETMSPLTGHRVYLTSPSGLLEKTWCWPGRGSIPAEEAQPGFEHELDLWTTKVAKISPRWPLEVKPGYDPNAIFATLAPKVPPSKRVFADTRPLAEEFLKLRPASEDEQALFIDAYGKLGADSDYWAYTETSRALGDKRVTVTRVDPSKPEAERSLLLSIDGKTPTPDDVQRWRDDGGDIPKTLGDIPPLASLVDLRDLRVFQDESTVTVFELPMRGGSADFPAENFQALFRVNKTHRAFEDLTIKLRENLRVVGLVKVIEAGLHIHFQTLDPAHPPQPVLLKGGGAARIVLVKLARDFETTRTDYKRVSPFDEPTS